jgi:hypothetical protein
MKRRHVVVGALLVSAALTGPAGAGVMAAEREQPSAASGSARSEGRGVLATLSPTGNVVAGQTVKGKITVINDTEDLTPGSVSVLFDNPTKRPSWFTSYTCPAGWVDLGNGKANNPKAGCYWADSKDDLEGKDWPPGSRAVIPVTLKVPAKAAPGPVEVFAGGVSFFDPQSLAMSVYVDNGQYTVV